MSELLNMVLHLDDTLKGVAEQYGPWVYGILFGIVFAETGFVVTPFLPGDSLLFAVGALSGTGVLKLHIAAPLLLCAAILGNTVNYHVGAWLGPRIFKGEGKGNIITRLMSKKHLATANSFFEKHGGKAVMMGQFLPIVRTFCPFVAGAGAMTYSRFIMFNVVGAVLWVGICCGAGYLFGGMEIVKKNFSVVILGVIVVSLIPVAISFFNSRRQAAA